MKNKPEIAQARLDSTLAIDMSGGIPKDIQYMPPGKQTVAPYVNGKPRPMDITVGPDYATVFQGALTRALASASAGTGDKPFIDFNHDDAAAAGHPTEFYWGGNDAKTGGVRVKIAWTGSGKQAVENGDFLRFSPQWVFSKTTGEPLGLPINVGGLVNRAAFKTIAPLVAAAHGKGAWVAAAAEAMEDKETDEDEAAEDASGRAFDLSAKAQVRDDGDCETSFSQHVDAAKAHEQAAAMMESVGRHDQAKMHKHVAEHHKTMAIHFGKQALAEPDSVSQAKLAEITAYTKSTNMTDTEIATAVAKAVEQAVAPLKTELESLKKNSSDVAIASAKATVQLHIKRGAIAPNDTSSQEFWEKALIANASGAEAQLNRLPGKKLSQLTTGNGDNNEVDVTPQGTFMAKAKEYGTANKLSDTDAMIAYAKTPEGATLYKEFQSNARRK